MKYLTVLFLCTSACNVTETGNPSFTGKLTVQAEGDVDGITVNGAWFSLASITLFQDGVADSSVELGTLVGELASPAELEFEVPTAAYDSLSISLAVPRNPPPGSPTELQSHTMVIEGQVTGADAFVTSSLAAPTIEMIAGRPLPKDLHVLISLPTLLMNVGDPPEPEFDADLASAAALEDDAGQVLSIPAPACMCNGDVNRNGDLNTGDMSSISPCIGMTPSGTCANADVNCDGVVNECDRDAVRCMVGTAATGCCLADCTP